MVFSTAFSPQQIYPITFKILRQPYSAAPAHFLPSAKKGPVFFMNPANCKIPFPVVSFSYKQRGDTNAEGNLDSHEKRNRKICFPESPEDINS